MKNAKDSFIRIRISTAAMVVLFIVALTLATLGFSRAPDSRVEPITVSIFMLTSAAAFGIMAVVGLSRKQRWSRFFGVAAVVAALYMTAMAYIFYTFLSSIQVTY